MLDNFLPSAVYSSDYQRHLLPPLLAGTIGTINTITPPPHISVSLSPTDFELSFIESSVQPKKRPARMARSTKKAPRHPSAPKRNMSAYLMYQNAMRESFKAQNPGMSFGQLSKYSSAMYAQLSPTEKEEWQKQAAADKTRYEQQIAIYVPPPGYDARGDAIAPPMPRSKKSKTVRDDNAPKRNVSAYLLYQNAMRERFRSENPQFTFGELAKYTSQQYAKLSPAEKQAWEQGAQDDKARYEVEMSTYIPPAGYDARGNMVMHDPTYRNVGGGGGMASAGGGMYDRRKRPRDPNAPKRARGPYVMFTFDARPQIQAEMPQVKFVDMGNVMGERWRALTPEQKRKYEELAAQDKLRFERESEEYNRKKEELEQQQMQMHMHHHGGFISQQ